MSSTCLPWSRKYSAIAVATSAPRARTSAAWSPVATMTTDFASPSGPERVLDEVADLAAALAQQRDHVDVGGRVARDHPQQRALAHAAPGEDPDALPACRSVSRPSIARTPVSSGSMVIWRSSGFGGSAESGTRSSASILPLPSIGCPRPLSTRPSRPGPTSTPNERPSGCTLLPGMQPLDLAERHEQHAALVEAHDLGEHRVVVAQAGHPAELAEPTSIPTASITSPTTRVTRP
jgi:hypothetical protein